MKSFSNDGFYDLRELRGWVTSRARLPTLGSRLVILIEFYIAPRDSQDLRQEVGVAQERLLRSGKCSKTQVGHSGQQSLSLISSSHVERADSAGHWLRAGILLNTATQQEAGTANRPELALERKFIFQSWPRDCSSFYLLLPEETTMEINVKIHPRSRKMKEAPKCLSSREWQKILLNRITDFHGTSNKNELEL